MAERSFYPEESRATTGQPSRRSRAPRPLRRCWLVVVKVDQHRVRRQYQPKSAIFSSPFDGRVFSGLMHNFAQRWRYPGVLTSRSGRTDYAFGEPPLRRELLSSVGSVPPARPRCATALALCRSSRCCVADCTVGNIRRSASTPRLQNAKPDNAHPKEGDAAHEH